ncbi:MAG: CBS domain-containing protein [Actinobacteria bacterium]|nr:CBS domain-containing protein [Actinomycetota bacterium]
MEIIVTHVSSDFDSFAGMIAAKKIYPRAEIILPSSINQNVRKFITLHEDALPSLRDSREINLDFIDRVIIIDTKIPSRLGTVKDLLNSKKIEIIIYDHHQKSEEDIANGINKMQNVGATTTILVEEIKKKKIKLTPFEATLFCLGIYEDTGSFTYPSTSHRDLNAATFLKKQGANLVVVSKFLNLSLTDEQHDLLEKLITNSKKISVNEKEIILSSAETDKFIEGLSILTRKLAQIEDIDIVFCWVKMRDKIYAVARSDDIEVDVSKVLDVIGGGGHSQASSAVIKDLSFVEIENKIRTSLFRVIKKPFFAKDIMSYPVRVVSEDESIYKVNELLKRYGHSGIPIVDLENNLAGIITRKDIDRAIKHGLSHAPVKGFKSRGIVTTGPNTTIQELQKLMVENAIGRIPIIQKGEIVGIVTRKDILRFLHGRNYLKYPEKVKGKKRYDYTVGQIIERINSLFPKKIIKILEIVSMISKELKYRPYLVGGIVRDLLLGIPNLDIDIVVEGDGIIFARRLAEILKARVDCHEKFKTAVLVLEDGKHIDIASARVEYYEKPAALPDVEPGNIRQDLARRDFTINTLALSLNRNNFGEILDFFGGRKDLALKRIKVLHKMSFIEDPTRIFRAVRFEQRLGFKIDSQTEKLALSTIDLNIVSELTGIRIREELISIFNEDNQCKALKRLFGMGALKKIGLNVNVDDVMVEVIRSAIGNAKKMSVYFTGGFEMWRMILVILMLKKRTDFIEKWCFSMKTKKKDIDILMQSVSNYSRLKYVLGRTAVKNSTLYSYLHDKSEEIKIIASTISKGHYKNVRRYYDKLSNIRLFINGNDLRNLNFQPSENFKVILGRILKLKLNGEIETREEELKKAEELFRILS